MSCSGRHDNDIYTVVVSDMPTSHNVEPYPASSQSIYRIGKYILYSHRSVASISYNIIILVYIYIYFFPELVNSNIKPIEFPYTGPRVCAPQFYLFTVMHYSSMYIYLFIEMRTKGITTTCRAMLAGTDFLICRVILTVQV